MCIVPSRTESFGLVALEAAACGTPVVAASVGGLRSLVDDGDTGFLVDGRDPVDYAVPDRGCSSTTPSSRAEMGITAAARSRRYSWSIDRGAGSVGSTATSSRARSCAATDAMVDTGVDTVLDAAIPRRQARR